MNQPTKLPSDFTMSRYGITVRLANENDSDFILSLRTDKKIARFLKPTDNDLSRQIEYMQEYKKSEIAGKHYYFIYYYKGFPIGINRIYDIKSNRATFGGWACKSGTEAEVSLATILLARDILFEKLKLDFDDFDVMKGNKHSHKLHKMMGAVVTGESEKDIFYELSKENYYKHRSEIIDLLNIKK
jgi:hypothetical protein